MEGDAIAASDGHVYDRETILAIFNKAQRESKSADPAIVQLQSPSARTVFPNFDLAQPLAFNSLVDRLVQLQRTIKQDEGTFDLLEREKVAERQAAELREKKLETQLDIDRKNIAELQQKLADKERQLELERQKSSEAEKSIKNQRAVSRSLRIVNYRLESDMQETLHMGEEKLRFLLRTHMRGEIENVQQTIQHEAEEDLEKPASVIFDSFLSLSRYYFKKATTCRSKWNHYESLMKSYVSIETYCEIVLAQLPDQDPLSKSEMADIFQQYKMLADDFTKMNKESFAGLLKSCGEYAYSCRRTARLAQTLEPLSFLKSKVIQGVKSIEWYATAILKITPINGSKNL